MNEAIKKAICTLAVATLIVAGICAFVALFTVIAHAIEGTIWAYIVVGAWLTIAVSYLLAMSYAICEDIRRNR